MENNIFQCKPLLEDGFTADILNFYIEKKTGKGLEKYLKYFAIKDAASQLSNTFLIREKGTDYLVGYFSLKAGGIPVNEKNRGITSEFDMIPGIELANFAVNDNYKKKHPDIKHIGTIIFSDFVLPIIREVRKYSAVRVVYIFSLPYKPLLNYYEKLGFQRLERKEEKKLHRRVKPAYDRGCIFMYRLI